MPEKKRKGQVTGQEGPELQHSAFVAARAAIKGEQPGKRGFWHCAVESSRQVAHKRYSIVSWNRLPSKGEAANAGS